MKVSINGWKVILWHVRTAKKVIIWQNHSRSTANELII